MPLSDDQLRAIGRITVLFGQLEHSTTLLLQVLDNPEMTGPPKFLDYPFSRMLKTARKLCREALSENAELRSSIEDWTERAKEVAERRNQVLHGLWAYEPTGEMVALLLTRENMPKESPRAADLDQLAEDVVWLVSDLEDFLMLLLPPG